MRRRSSLVPGALRWNVPASNSALDRAVRPVTSVAEAQRPRQSAPPVSASVSRTYGRLSLVAVLSIITTTGCRTLGRPTCATASALVENTISAKARELNGLEYCQFRRYYGLDDLDGDHVDDLIVLFNVEGTGGGGNNVFCFMAVLLSKEHWNPVVVETGERGIRLPNGVSVRGHTIILETMEYKAGDAFCCPSGKGELRYEVEGASLRPIPGPGGG